MAETAAAARTPGERIHFQIFEGRAESVDPVPTAVVCPCDGVSLAGALEAADRALIVPILVGPRTAIEAAAGKLGRSLEGIEIVEAGDDATAAPIRMNIGTETRLNDDSEVNTCSPSVSRHEPP